MGESSEVDRTARLERTANELAYKYAELSAALEQLQIASPTPRSPEPAATPGSGIRLVVQRCNRASLLLEDDVWGCIERGLVVFVTFAKGASSEGVKRAVKTLCSAPLVTFGLWGDSSTLWSMSDLVADGKWPQVLAGELRGLSEQCGLGDGGPAAFSVLQTQRQSPPLPRQRRETNVPQSVSGVRVTAGELLRRP